MILSHVHEARSGRKGQPVFQSSLGWLAPDYTLWGRGDDFRQSVDAFRKAIRNTGKGMTFTSSTGQTSVKSRL